MVDENIYCHACGLSNGPADQVCKGCGTLLKKASPAAAAKASAEQKPETKAPAPQNMHIDDSKPINVVVTNIDISFTNMVGLMVKAAFAIIPALLIVFVVTLIFFSVIGIPIAGINR